MQYGAYKTIRELSSGSAATVFLAADAAGDSAKPRFAIKLCTAGADIGGLWHTDVSRDIASASVSGFLAATTRQKRAHAAGARHIAAVHDGGTSEQGPWFATDYYSRTAYKLIEGHVALNPEALHHIIRSVVRGALEFKAHTGHSHGNLKPANVLIGGHRDLNRAPVILSDPSAIDSRDAEALEMADLRAIGEMLYQFVRRRGDVSGADQWPLQMSSDWQTAFAEQASPWLALCNQLLDPGLSLAAFNLEALDHQLARFAPKQSGAWLKIAAVIVAVGMIGVGVWIWSTRTSDPDVVIVTPPPPTRSPDVGTPVAPPAVPLRPVATVGLVVTPSGASLFTNGVMVRSVKSIELDQPVGEEVLYKLELPGYDTASFTHTAVADQPFSTNVTLKRSTGSLRVRVPSELAGASIFIEDKLSGIADDKGELLIPDLPTTTNRSTKITGKFDGLDDATNNVVIRKGENPPIDLDFQYGYVTVMASSAGNISASIEAKVSDGVSTWDSGRTRLVPAGRISLTIKPSDPEFAEKIETRIVPLRGTTDVSVSFQRGTYPVSFISIPSGAKIFLDGATTALAPTPHQGSLVAGPYTVRFEYGDLAPTSNSLTVKAKEQNAVTGRFDFVELALSTVPSGAKFWWKGEQYETPKNLYLTPGVSGNLDFKQGDLNGSLALSSLPHSGRYPTNVTLTREQGWVRFKVDPPGATLSRGDNSSVSDIAANVPVRFFVGTNTIVASYPGLADKVHEFTVHSGVSDNAPEVKVIMDYGRLRITSSLPVPVPVFHIENGKKLPLGSVTNPLELIQKPGTNDYSFGDGLTEFLPETTNLFIRKGETVVHPISLGTNWNVLWTNEVDRVSKAINDCDFSTVKSLCAKYPEGFSSGLENRPGKLLDQAKRHETKRDSIQTALNAGNYGQILDSKFDDYLWINCFSTLIKDAKFENEELQKAKSYTSPPGNFRELQKLMSKLGRSVTNKPPFTPITVWLATNNPTIKLDRELTDLDARLASSAQFLGQKVTKMVMYRELPRVNTKEGSRPDKRNHGPSLAKLLSEYDKWHGNATNSIDDEVVTKNYELILRNRRDITAELITAVKILD